MHITLKHGFFILEPPLPDVPAGLVVPVVTLSMRDPRRKTLHHAADGRFERFDQQMDVVGHQAVPVQLERPPFF